MGCSLVAVFKVNTWVDTRLPDRDGPLTHSCFTETVLSKSIREWTQDCLTETVPDTRLSHRDGPFKVTFVSGHSYKAVWQRRFFQSHLREWTQGCLTEMVLDTRLSHRDGPLKVTPWVDTRLLDRDGPWYKAVSQRRPFQSHSVSAHSSKAVWPRRSFQSHLREWVQGCLTETVLDTRLSQRDGPFKVTPRHRFQSPFDSSWPLTTDLI